MMRKRRTVGSRAREAALRDSAETASSVAWHGDMSVIDGAQRSNSPHGDFESIPATSSPTNDFGPSFGSPARMGGSPNPTMQRGRAPSVPSRSLSRRATVTVHDPDVAAAAAAFARRNAARERGPATEQKKPRTQGSLASRRGSLRDSTHAVSASPSPVPNVPLVRRGSVATEASFHQPRPAHRVQQAQPLHPQQHQQPFDTIGGETVASSSGTFSTAAPGSAAGMGSFAVSGGLLLGTNAASAAAAATAAASTAAAAAMRVARGRTQTYSGGSMRSLPSPALDPTASYATHPPGAAPAGGVPADLLLAQGGPWSFGLRGPPPTPAANRSGVTTPGARPHRHPHSHSPRARSGTPGASPSGAAGAAGGDSATACTSVTDADGATRGPADTLTADSTTAAANGGGYVVVPRTAATRETAPTSADTNPLSAPLGRSGSGGSTAVGAAVLVRGAAEQTGGVWDGGSAVADAGARTTPHAQRWRQGLQADAWGATGGGGYPATAETSRRGSGSSQSHLVVPQTAPPSPRPPPGDAAHQLVPLPHGSGDGVKGAFGKLAMQMQQIHAAHGVRVGAAGFDSTFLSTAGAASSDVAAMTSSATAHLYAHAHGALPLAPIGSMQAAGGATDPASFLSGHAAAVSGPPQAHAHRHVASAAHSHGSHSAASLPYMSQSPPLHHYQPYASQSNQQNQYLQQLQQQQQQQQQPQPLYHINSPYAPLPASGASHALLSPQHAAMKDSCGPDTKRIAFSADAVVLDIEAAARSAYAAALHGAAPVASGDVISAIANDARVRLGFGTSDDGGQVGGGPGMRTGGWSAWGGPAVGAAAGGRGPTLSAFAGAVGGITHSNATSGPLAGANTAAYGHHTAEYPPHSGARFEAPRSPGAGDRRSRAVDDPGAQSPAATAARRASSPHGMLRGAAAIAAACGAVRTQLADVDTFDLTPYRDGPREPRGLAAPQMAGKAPRAPDPPIDLGNARAASHDNRRLSPSRSGGVGPIGGLLATSPVRQTPASAARDAASPAAAGLGSVLRSTAVADRITATVDSALDAFAAAAALPLFGGAGGADRGGPYGGRGGTQGVTASPPFLAGLGPDWLGGAAHTLRVGALATAHAARSASDAGPGGASLPTPAADVAEALAHALRLGPYSRGLGASLRVDGATAWTHGATAPAPMEQPSHVAAVLAALLGTGHGHAGSNNSATHGTQSARQGGPADAGTAAAAAAAIHAALLAADPSRCGPAATPPCGADASRRVGANDGALAAGLANWWGVSFGSEAPVVPGSGPAVSADVPQVPKVSVESATEAGSNRGSLAEEDSVRRAADAPLHALMDAATYADAPRSSVVPPPLLPPYPMPSVPLPPASPTPPVVPVAPTPSAAPAVPAAGESDSVATLVGLLRAAAATLTGTESAAAAAAAAQVVEAAMVADAAAAKAPQPAPVTPGESTPTSQSAVGLGAETGAERKASLPRSRGPPALSAASESSVAQREENHRRRRHRKKEKKAKRAARRAERRAGRRRDTTSSSSSSSSSSTSSSADGSPFGWVRDAGESPGGAEGGASGSATRPARGAANIARPHTPPTLTTAPVSIRGSAHPHTDPGPAPATATSDTRGRSPPPPSARSVASLLSPCGHDEDGPASTMNRMRSFERRRASFRAVTTLRRSASAHAAAAPDVCGHLAGSLSGSRRGSGPHRSSSGLAARFNRSQLAANSVDVARPVREIIPPLHTSEPSTTVSRAGSALARSSSSAPTRALTDVVGSVVVSVAGSSSSAHGSHAVLPTPRGGSGGGGGGPRVSSSSGDAARGVSRGASSVAAAAYVGSPGMRPFTGGSSSVFGAPSGQASVASGAERRSSVNSDGAGAYPATSARQTPSPVTVDSAGSGPPMSPVDQRRQRRMQERVAQRRTSQRSDMQTTEASDTAPRLAVTDALMSDSVFGPLATLSADGLVADFPNDPPSSSAITRTPGLSRFAARIAAAQSAARDAPDPLATPVPVVVFARTQGGDESVISGRESASVSSATTLGGLTASPRFTALKSRLDKMRGTTPPRTYSAIGPPRSTLWQQQQPMLGESRSAPRRASAAAPPRAPSDEPLARPAVTRRPLVSSTTDLTSGQSTPLTEDGGSIRATSPPNAAAATSVRVKELLAARRARVAAERNLSETMGSVATDSVPTDPKGSPSPSSRERLQNLRARLGRADGGWAGGRP